MANLFKVQVVPPSVVMRRVPFVPTAQPRKMSTKRTLRSDASVPPTGFACEDHVAPPSVVRRIVPFSPIAQPFIVSTNETPFRVLSVPLVWSRHPAELVGAGTGIGTGLDVDWIPPLSVATAVSEYDPVGTFDHVIEKGALIEVPIRPPFWKKSTRTTVPSVSSARASITIVAGAGNVEFPGGLVMSTVGASSTMTVMGLDVVLAPPLSVATAEME